MGRSSSDYQDDRDSSESEDQLTELKSLILDRISDVHSTGSFATFKCLESFVLPGISVDNAGAIRLPLSSGDAQTIIRVSCRAPFGKGNQTLIDESVRKTWEIDGSKVSFSNKAWQGWLDGVVRKAAKDLGVAGGPNSVQAELYKMLLYEKGAMFKPHKDTEKTPGMFGTLVICLPSEHVGGAVRLSHGHKKKIFDTASSSAFNTTYIAWYADVTHEIEPIQSGCRWVLTYNLINISPSFPQSAAGLDAQVDRFCQTLTKWRGLDNGPQYLCYALDHQYTDAGLKLANLKGDDYNHARLVADACSRAGDFCVLLASMQKVVTFMNDEGGEENAESRIRLDTVFDLEGFILQNSLGIAENLILQHSLYDSRDPDNQRGGEYMGNQHGEIDQTYNDTAMLIIPKAFTTDFLLGSNRSLNHFERFLKRLQNLFRTRNNDQQIRELIVQTCQNHLTEEYPNAWSKDLFMGKVAVAAVFIADQGLFRNAVHSVTTGFNESIFSVLGELICLQTPVVPEKDLVEAFSRIQNLRKVRRCLQTFRDGYTRKNLNSSDKTQVEYLANWIRDRMSKALKSIQEVDPQDAAALIEIVKEYDNKIFEECVKPFIARCVGNSSFVNAMAVEILSFSQSSSPDKELVARLFPLILDAAASQFELEKYSSAAKNSHDCTDYPYSSWPDCHYENDKGRRDASIIVKLHQRLLETDRKKASKLLGRIQSQSQSLRHEELDRLVLPLLEQMMSIVDLCPSDACQFYQSMMATYITRVVQKEPEKPSDWARPNEHKRCDGWECRDCESLQKILLDPTEESRRFISLDSWHRKYNVPKQCKISTDESQKPPAIIVSKTLKGWEEDHEKWQERASKAQEAFRRLPQKELKQCLTDKYDAIMDLGIVKLQDKDTTAQTTETLAKSVGNQSDEQPQSVLPQKRARSDS